MKSIEFDIGIVQSMDTKSIDCGIGTNRSGVIWYMRKKRNINKYCFAFSATQNCNKLQQNKFIASKR